MEKFECPKCKCSRFWRVRHLEILIDFSREGAIPGYPFIQGPEQEYMPTGFRCAECGYWMPVVENIEKAIL